MTILSFTIRPFSLLVTTLALAALPLAQAQQAPAVTPKVETPKSMQSGASIQYELWSWGEDEAGRKKLRDLKDGDRIPMEGLPNDVQFRFRVAADHNGLVFKARSADGEHKLGWESKELKATDEPPAERLYRARAEGYYPQPGKYTLEVKGLKGGNVIGENVTNIEFVPAPRKPVVRDAIYANSVGMNTPFLKSQAVGASVTYELWDWREKDRKKFADIKEGVKVPLEKLPERLQFQFRIGTDFDALTWRCRTTDSNPESTWSKKDIPAAEAGPQQLFKAGNLGFFPQVGKYCLEVKAEKAGKVVAHNITTFEIVGTKPIPVNTTYLAGKKDWKGTPITTSKPVNLGPLNETPILKDNDYAFEPQKALTVVNWERFPPFKMHPRFPMVWASKRFEDEDKFGGPLNRGFTTLATIDSKIDNLKVSERCWFHYPGQLIGMIDEMIKKDPVKYADVKGYKDDRSAFISAENATLLGKMCYEGWGVAGWGPYDPGIYGWDEEEMFPPIATRMMKEKPDKLPERLVAKYKEKVLAGDQAAINALEKEYSVAMAEFIGNTYKGARESAASRGRKLKIWHYGSLPPARELYMLLGSTKGVELNPQTGKYPYEEIEGVHDWFKRGRTLDFNATAFSREIDYFHTDFYFHISFPEKQGIYEKDKSGSYVLDDKGRRKFRRDMITEDTYGMPVKIGLEDYEWAPIFLKSYIAKLENNQFWFNGGKYYKTPGTQITDKQLGPYIRPGTQETFGDIAKIGSRPVNPYMAEATAIMTFMMGGEALFVWDEGRGTSPVGQPAKAGKEETFGDLEFAIKGLHRVSQFNRLFDGTYSFVRPTRHYNTHNRDHPIIRGLVNGQYLMLGMTNPYLDLGEKQEVEIWYDSPYSTRTAKWAGKAVINARKTHIYQCKLPPLPAGQAYDPDKLYFRYTLKDGRHTETFTVSGNYDVKYPFPN